MCVCVSGKGALQICSYLFASGSYAVITDSPMNAHIDDISKKISAALFFMNFKCWVHENLTRMTLHIFTIHSNCLKLSWDLKGKRPCERV